MRSEGLSERYVNALVGLDLKGLTLKQIQAEISTFALLYRQSSDLRSLLENPFFSREQRKAVVKVLAQRLGVSVVCRNFLNLLIDKKRTSLLPDIAQGLERHIDAQAGVARARVRTVTPLDTLQLNALASALSKLRGQPVKVTTSTDPTLLGGVVVEMDGRVYDGSVKKRLSSIRDLLLQDAQ